MSRVAEILLAQGRSAGEAARAHRQIWGQALSDIAQLPGQIQQQRIQQQRVSALALLEQAREARARGEEERAQALFQQAERTHQNQKQIAAAMLADDPTTPNVTAGVQKAVELGEDPAWAHELSQKLTPKLEQVKTRTPEGGEQVEFVHPTEGLTRTGAPPKVTYGAPTPQMVGGTRQLVRTGSDGKLYDMQGKPIDAAITPDQPPMTPYQGAELGMQGAARTETARHNRAMEAAAPKPDDAESIADAIISGDQPPVTTGLYRLAGPVRAALAKKGYDLTTANLDFQATQKHIATLNGAQQTRLRQAVATASDSLGVIEDLAKQWDAGKFPLLNRAQLALAKNGVMGPQAQQIATNLEAQITDVTSELGNVYMGGNSPTDHALQLAGKNLSADWNKDQLLSAIKLARTNLKIRGNSMTSVGAAGLSTAPASTPAPTTTPQIAPKLGEIVTVKGVRLRVTKVNPDGSYEGVGVK